MLLVDVMPVRSPRYRGIHAVERNPLTRADERPVIPVLPDIDRIRNVVLVPAALDVVARVVLEQLRSRRRRPSIHGKRALVAPDADVERRRLRAQARSLSCELEELAGLVGSTRIQARLGLLRPAIRNRPDERVADRLVLGLESLLVEQNLVRPRP